MAKKYNSAACQSIHEAATDLFEANAIDVGEMRDFDVLCLMPMLETVSMNASTPIIEIEELKVSE
jgi:DNA-binding transcriptional regulator YiaG